MMALSESPRRPRRPAAWTRPAGVWLFLALLVLVSLERRVAELDLGPDDDGAVLESDDGVDGGEILDRLVVFDDIRLPQPPDVGRLTVGKLVVSTTPYLPDVRIVTPTPRAPPAFPSPR